MSGKMQSWWIGKNESLEWLQYGQKDLKIPLLTITRTLDDGTVVVLIHKTNEKPGAIGPAKFSMETGAGDQTIAVDGFGFLLEMNDGSIGFETVPLNGKNKNVFTDVTRTANSELRVIVNEEQFIFPIYEFKADLENIFR